VYLQLWHMLRPALKISSNPSKMGRGPRLQLPK
jgi:hypothetical protein